MCVIGKKSHKKNKWIGDEVLRIPEQQKTIKRKIRNDKQQKYEYNLLTRKLKSKVANGKMDWIEKQCKDLEFASKTNDSRNLLSKAKELKSGLGHKVHNINIKDGSWKLLTNKSDVKDS